MITHRFAVAVLAGLAGTAFAVEPADRITVAEVPASLDPDLGLRGVLARTLASHLPPEERARIRAAGGENFLDPMPEVGLGVLPVGSRDERHALVSDVISGVDFDRISEAHRKLLVGMRMSINEGRMVPQLCFTPDTDPVVVEAVSALYNDAARFQQTSRWAATALSGAGLQQGQPTVITYGFVPDGTFVPNINGFEGNSQLRAWLNGIYAGGQTQWQPLFDQVFARWAELTGLSYQFEPNDDGSTLNTLGGVPGVRADVRIAAIPLDGNSGVLAYNNFPNDGDMVFDAFDSFYNSTTSNSLRLRNVIAHEHGHGIGMLHVCPANQTKLMEPFISTAYNGPQLDDILNGQRHYGDPFEPNDTAATASDIGTIGIGFTGARTNVSTDDNSDVDLYRFTTTGRVLVTAFVDPAAGAYDQGPQTQACGNTGIITDYNVIHNLALDLLASDGTTVLATADATGAGVRETLEATVFTAGTYFIRVRPNNVNNIQRYSLGYTGAVAPAVPLTIALDAQLPEFIAPGAATPVSITISPNEDTLVGSPTLFYRLNGGAFQTAPFVSAGAPNRFIAQLPAAACADSPEFYVSASGSLAGAQTLPAAGPAAPFSVTVGSPIETFDDNFQTDTGWTISGTITANASGRWQRGVPVGANDTRISDAPNDFDGSGQCYVTGNVLDNSDVDGGNTILTSPVFDLSNNPEAVLSYARWFNNNEGGSAANPFTETFEVDISNNNGTTWTRLETVGPTGAEVNGGWIERSFRVADFVPTTSQVRVRFVASDDTGTIVEAGVDAVRVTGLACEDVADPCPADFNGDTTPGDIFDLFDFLSALDGGLDFNGDTSPADIFDLFDFLAVLDAGCP